MRSLVLPVHANTRSAQRRVSALAAQVNRGATFNVRGGRGLGVISSKMTEFQKSLAASNARVLAFGASTGILFAFSRAMKGLAKDAVEVEKKLADINVILQASEKNFTGFSKSLFDIARATAQSFDKAAEAAAEFARQGLSIEETAKATQAALILTRLTGLEVTKSVESLTAVVNTFIASGVTYAEVVDQMASVDAAFAVSSADLAEGIKRVGSSAVDGKVSLEELQAAIAATKQVSGRDGAVIGNSLKTIFARLQTSSVQDALNSIGIATKDANGGFLNLIDVIDDLSNSLDSLGAQQAADIVEKVAGKRQINTFRALLSSLKGGTREATLFGNALRFAENSAGAASLRNEELNKTMSALLKTARTNVQEFSALGGEKIFGPLIGQIAGASSVFKNLADAINTDPQFRTTGQKIGVNILEGIGQVISGPGLLLAIAAISKVVGLVVRDIAGSSGALFQRNIAAQKQMEAIISKLSASDQKRLAAAGSQQAQQRILNDLLRQELILRQQSSSLVAGVAAAPRALRRQLSRFAEGHVPASSPAPSAPSGDAMFAVSAEASSIARGVGGARSTAVPIITSVDLGKGPQTVVVNSDEAIVDNFRGGKSSAIFNRHMMKGIGGAANLSEYGSVRRGFAKGHVPNFPSGSIPPLPPRQPIRLPNPQSILRDSGGKAIKDLGKITDATSKTLKNYDKALAKAASDAQKRGQSTTKFETRQRAVREENVRREKFVQNRSTASLVSIAGSKNPLNAVYGSAARSENTARNASDRAARQQAIATQQAAKAQQAAAAAAAKSAAHQESRSRLAGKVDRQREANRTRFASSLLSGGGIRGFFNPEGQIRRNAIASGLNIGQNSRSGVTGGNLQDRRIVQQAVDERRQQRRARFGQTALIGALALPLIGQFAGEAFKDGGKDTKKSKAVEGIATGLGTALILSSFGPVGIAAGALVGGFSVLKAVTKSLATDFDALAREIDQGNKLRQEEINAGQQFSNAQAILENLINSGASQDNIQKARLKRDRSLFSISDIELKRDLINAGDGEQRSSILQRLNEERGRLDAFGKTRLLIQQNVEQQQSKNAFETFALGKDGVVNRGDALRGNAERIVKGLVAGLDFGKVEESRADIENLFEQSKFSGGVRFEQLAPLLRDITDESANLDIQSILEVVRTTSDQGTQLSKLLLSQLATSFRFSDAKAPDLAAFRGKPVEDLAERALKTSLGFIGARRNLFDRERSDRIQSSINTSKNDLVLGGDRLSESSKAEIEFNSALNEILSGSLNKLRQLDSSSLSDLQTLSSKIDNEDDLKAFQQDLNTASITGNLEPFLDNLQNTLINTGDESIVSDFNKLRLERSTQFSQEQASREQALDFAKKQYDVLLKQLEEAKILNGLSGLDKEGFDEVSEKLSASLNVEFGRANPLRERQEAEERRKASFKGGDKLAKVLEKQARQRVVDAQTTIDGILAQREAGLIPKITTSSTDAEKEIVRSERAKLSSALRERQIGNIAGLANQGSDALQSNLKSIFDTRSGKKTVDRLFEDGLKQRLDNSVNKSITSNDPKLLQDSIGSIGTDFVGQLKRSFGRNREALASIEVFENEIKKLQGLSTADNINANADLRARSFLPDTDPLIKTISDQTRVTVELIKAIEKFDVNLTSKNFARAQKNIENIDAQIEKTAKERNRVLNARNAASNNQTSLDTSIALSESEIESTKGYFDAIAELRGTLPKSGVLGKGALGSLGQDVFDEIENLGIKGAFKFGENDDGDKTFESLRTLTLEEVKKINASEEINDRDKNLIIPFYSRFEESLLGLEKLVLSGDLNREEILDKIRGDFFKDVGQFEGGLSPKFGGADEDSQRIQDGIVNRGQGPTLREVFENLVSAQEPLPERSIAENRENIQTKSRESDSNALKLQELEQRLADQQNKIELLERNRTNVLRNSRSRNGFGSRDRKGTRDVIERVGNNNEVIRKENARQEKISEQINGSVSAFSESTNILREASESLAAIADKKVEIQNTIEHNIVLTINDPQKILNSEEVEVGLQENLKAYLKQIINEQRASDGLTPLSAPTALT